MALNSQVVFQVYCYQQTLELCGTKFIVAVPPVCLFQTALSNLVSQQLATMAKGGVCFVFSSIFLVFITTTTCCFSTQVPRRQRQDAPEKHRPVIFVHGILPEPDEWKFPQSYITQVKTPMLLISFLTRRIRAIMQAE